MTEDVLNSRMKDGKYSRMRIRVLSNDFDKKDNSSTKSAKSSTIVKKVDDLLKDYLLWRNSSDKDKKDMLKKVEKHPEFIKKIIGIKFPQAGFVNEIKYDGNVITMLHRSDYDTSSRNPLDHGTKHYYSILFNGNIIGSRSSSRYTKPSEAKKDVIRQALNHIIVYKL